jgi:crotonobetainyl-CoA:carnitine CoA-transferase CaiB-like acyl-CoA transferase
VKNRAALAAELQRVFERHGVQHWLEALEAKGIPAGAVLDVERALAQPSLKARGMLPVFQHPAAGALTLVGSPLPGADAGRAPPPLLGQHTAEVLRALGVTDEELARLAQSGAIRGAG